MKQPAALPLDITKIRWDGGGMPRFEVFGTQQAQALIDSDPTANLQFLQNVELRHDIPANQIGVLLRIDLQITRGEPAQPAGVGGRFEVLFVFAIDNLPDLLVTSADDTPVPHPQLSILLTSVAYSTARGILWTRFAGTPLEGITLPLVNPSQLLQAAAPALPTSAAPAKVRAAPTPRKKSPKPAK